MVTRSSSTSAPGASWFSTGHGKRRLSAESQRRPALDSTGRCTDTSCVVLYSPPARHFNRDNTNALQRGSSDLWARSWAARGPAGVRIEAGAGVGGRTGAAARVRADHDYRAIHARRESAGPEHDGAAVRHARRSSRANLGVEG